MLIKCADAISIEQRSDTSDPCDLTSDLRDPKFNPRPGCPKFIVCTKFGDRGSNRFGLIEFEKNTNIIRPQTKGRHAAIGFQSVPYLQTWNPVTYKCGDPGPYLFSPSLSAL